MLSESTCCKGHGWVFYRSTNKKQCSGCNKVFDWTLDPGQQPLLNNNRVKYHHNKEHAKWLENRTNQKD